MAGRAGLRARGLIDGSEQLTDAGPETTAQIEALTDDLVRSPYDSLSGAELEEPIVHLEPMVAVLDAAGSR